MTVLIAKIAGLYLVLTGTGFLTSRAFYQRMIADNAGAHPVTLNLSGAAHFIVGMIILVNHWRWGSVPEIAVSLLGAAAALKGASLIAVPELTLKSPRTAGTSLALTGGGFILAGLYFCYVGFWPG